MEYERKYKAALKWMQSLYSGLHGATKEEAEKYFPELKESEDERVRKAIIRILKGETGYTSKEDTDKYVAWLEKQGKRLGADEVTKHQWISVEDELPEVCVAVLTTTPHGTQRVGFYEDGWWLANTPDLVRLGSITHWMPLPPPPHHIIDANKKVDRVIGTADHIKTALDVLNKKGGEE